MRVSLLSGRDEVTLEVPDSSIVYESKFPPPVVSAAEAVLEAVRKPICAPPLGKLLKTRGEGDVVVVVSDITRPVPYARFLPAFLREIENAGVKRGEILILVATGMHRRSTSAEHGRMFGEVAGKYRILDHDAGGETNLLELPGRSASGAKVSLNRRYTEAGFRIITGLVEPHFMAGFSGGRKAVCPGIASLVTIKNFHGAEFLADPLARNANLEGNPCHEEALSVARMAGVDFSLNVVLNEGREVVRVFAGDLESAHDKATSFVRECACPVVEREADVVLTSSGGYPLDATFYQCVKSLVTCLPAVKKGGVIVSFGGCSEGIGSPEYAALVAKYSGRWRDFLRDIRHGLFVKDQWQFQMHTRSLEKVGRSNLYFVTDGLSEGELSRLSVNGHAARRGGVESAVREILGKVLARGKNLAVLPEGPYCAPINTQ